MNAKMTQFLLIALVLMAVCLGLGGGWLLPQLGFEPPLTQVMPAALGGALIALIYFRMFKRPDGA